MDTSSNLVSGFYNSNCLLQSILHIGTTKLVYVVHRLSIERSDRFSLSIYTSRRHQIQLVHHILIRPDQTIVFLTGNYIRLHAPLHVLLDRARCIYISTPFEPLLRPYPYSLIANTTSNTSRDHFLAYTRPLFNLYSIVSSVFDHPIAVFQSTASIRNSILTHSVLRLLSSTLAY